MNRQPFTIFALAMPLAVAWQGTAAAQTVTYEHLDRLAVELEAHAGGLEREIRHSYAHTREYPHLMADTRQLSAYAAHFHEVAHRHGSVTHLRNDLRWLNHWYEHLDRLLSTVDIDFDHIGPRHGHGHAAHARRLMQQIGVNLHHLRRDLLVLRPHAGSIHWYSQWPGNLYQRRPCRTFTVPVPPNYGEIRSGWTRSLNDL